MHHHSFYSVTQMYFYAHHLLVNYKSCIAGFNDILVISPKIQHSNHLSLGGADWALMWLINVLRFLSDPFLNYLLGSKSHLGGVCERVVSVWKFELLPGEFVMETETLSSDKKAGRSEASVPSQLRSQKQQLCHFHQR